MKIAYVTKTSWGENSPGFIFSFYQANGIAENNSNITLIMKNHDYGNPDSHDLNLKKSNNLNIKLIRNNIGPIKANEFFYYKVNRFIIENNFDIIFTRDPGYLPFLVKLKKKFNKKIFYQSHNFYMDFTIHEYKGSHNRRKFSRFEKRYVRHLDGMMTLNEPQKLLYKKYTTIPIHSCNPGLHKLNKLTGSFAKKSLVYTGSFQPTKGIKEILEIWEKGKFDGSLLLAGGRNNKELSYVESLLSESKVSNVKLRKWIPYNSLSKILINSSIGLIILPENFYNQFLTAPTKLYDYIAHGLPVVCTDLPSTRDLIPEGHKGVRYVKPNDIERYIFELKDLISNEKKYQEAQNANLKLIDDLSWKKQAEKIKNIMINKV